MTWVMVDIEADGPIPWSYSMISIGAVVVEPSLSKTFYIEIQPISNQWDPDALLVANFTREETFKFEAPYIAMEKFELWLKSIKKSDKDRLMFISDNNGFDYMFVHWYFIHFCGHDPFGHSSTNLGSLYKGLTRNMTKNFKYLRKTRHSHNALQDAIGNAEAFLTIINNFNLHIY